MWRRRKNKDAEEAKESISNKAALGISKMINRMQHRFGETLNRKTAQLTQRGKIILFIVFCLLFGGGSLYVFIDGFTSSRSFSRALKPGAISVPKHVTKTGNDNQPIKAIITAEDIRKIKRFRRYMDSLKISKNGVFIYDSIINARPGLMDSVTEVERVYGFDTSMSN